MRNRVSVYIRPILALHIPAAILTSILIASPLKAQFLVKPVNLAYLAQRADVIVHGSVVDVVNEGMSSGLHEFEYD